MQINDVSTFHLLLFYLSLFALQFITGEKSKSFKNLYSCDPFVDCINYGVGASVPDPDDCHNYYLCISGSGNSTPSDVVLTCPEGEAFDYLNGNCITETKPCVNECFNHCQAYCIQDLTLVADPYNCSAYYVCLGDEQIEASCSADFPYFDGATCTDNIQLCCNICQPYCDNAFIETYDPYNCTNFYLCTQIGVPSEDSLYSCERGEYFNPILGKCDVEDPLDSCQSLCSSTIEPTSSTLLSETKETYFE